MMRKKIGLFGDKTQDENLINNLLSWMNQTKADYTNTFCALMKKDIKKNKMFQDSAFIDWYKQWMIRIAQNKKSAELSLNLMHTNNPLVIPRNHKVEEALDAASNNGDLKPTHKLLNILKKPYEDKLEIVDYQLSPTSSEKIYKTFCGT